jgi:hypothetical protein
MKIKDLIELMGVYESVRILDTQYNEIVRCVAVELPEELSEKFVGNIYTSGGSINIVALDKYKRRWYNKT